VGRGEALGLATEEVGDEGGVGDFSSFPNGVLLGVADFAGFDGAVVGDLRASADVGFDFALAVVVGLGVGVCALRSTPR
jgi:hypothetical protein